MATKKIKGKVKSKVKGKRKGKQWYIMIAPEMFGRVEMGRTLSSDPKNVVGRNVTVSLMDLVNDFHKYYMKFVFKVSDIDGDNANTVFVGSRCMRDYVSRMVSRWATRIDTIQDLTTKDGTNIRVKGILIIPRRVKSSIKSSVRNEVRETIQKDIEKSTLEEVVNSLISDNTKRRVLRNAQKIYPVKNFEIRKIEVLSKQVSTTST